MQCERKKKQLNNGGFSLLEVLVAMVILAIVSIPLLHSFVTTARTNAKAKVLMKATDVAENTVETFKNQDVETLIAQYSAGTGNSVVVTDGMQSGTYTAADDGIVQFSVYDQGDFSIDLPEGYYMEVELNPNLYPNANAVNMAEMNTVSATTSGVYRMLNDFDNMVYETFALRSANAPAGYGYVLKDEKYFKENLKREILVTIEKKGTATDDNGEEVELVTVKCKLKYTLADTGEKVLPASEQVYETDSKELFNNVASKIPLQSVFILYQPRYLANAKYTDGEVIRIDNYQNVETNVYVIGQETPTDVSYRPQYYSKTTGPQIIVTELTSSGSGSDVDAGISLFTNFSTGAPYMQNDAADSASLLGRFVYKNLVKEYKNESDLLKILDMRDLDGKHLSKEMQEKRIYKMTVKVFDGKNAKPLVSLDGTKID